MISLWRKFLNERIARRASHWALSAVLLTACSCSSAGRKTASTAADPFLDEDSTQQAAANPADQASGQARVTLLPAPVAEPASPQPDGPPEYEIAAHSGGRQLETATVHGSARSNPAIQLTAAEERCPEFVNAPVIDESPAAAAKLYPDEYLFDGGDREFPIHYSDAQMLGLESEDAAVEYRDDLGNRHVKPTNRVAIYSPRFAAVTSATQSIEDVGGGRPVQSTASQSGIGLANREGTFAQHQRDATERLVTRARGSGLTTGAAADAIDRPIGIHGHVHTTTPALDFAFLRTGLLKQSEEARLAASIQSASVWTRDQNPVVTAKSEQAIVLKSEFKERELVGQENRFNGKGKLRIVKSADKRIAEPGDVVKFSIRYDNLGDREVRDVVIVDNLTPRLEYVDDSATCDVDGILEVEDNGEGSVILRWVLEAPLRGRSGGVVTFEARVR